MTHLSKLTIKSVQRAGRVDPTLSRRRKLADALDEQMKVASASEKGQQHTVLRKSWGTNEQGEKVSVDRQRSVKPWFFEQDGGWYVQCKYGSKSLLLGKDANAVFVAKLTDVRGALASLKAAVDAGELDKAIEAALERKPK